MTESKDRLAKFKPIRPDRTGNSKEDRPERASELDAHKCIVQRQLYIRSLLSPTIEFNASHAAKKCIELHSRRIRKLNTTLRTFKPHAATVRYLSSIEGVYQP